MSANLTKDAIQREDAAQIAQTINRETAFTPDSCQAVDAVAKFVADRDIGTQFRFVRNEFDGDNLYKIYTGEIGPGDLESLSRSIEIGRKLSEKYPLTIKEMCKAWRCRENAKIARGVRKPFPQP